MFGWFVELAVFGRSFVAFAVVGWLFVAFTLIGQSNNVGFGLVKFS